MVMNFWQAQQDAKTKTFYYLLIFFILTIVSAVVAELAMRTFAQNNYGDPDFPYVGAAFMGITLLTAGFNYLQYTQAGGSYVAESVGAVQVDPQTRNPKERQLLNIVEEIALATSLPVPPVYIMQADEINAFAAGTTPENAAITVTTGSLNLLTRDELQGVLAHEFGHIYNRDMTIGMRVAAMVMGFFVVMFLGLRLMEGSFYLGGGERSSRDGEDRKGGNPTLIIALILIVLGSLMWFFGSILQSMVSRQRELLADASSVQYTRNPEGLANALKKIADMQVQDMPKSAQPFAHLYFNERQSFWSRLFATHPPIQERIDRILKGEP